MKKANKKKSITTTLMLRSMNYQMSAVALTTAYLKPGETQTQSFASKQSFDLNYIAAVAFDKKGDRCDATPFQFKKIAFGESALIKDGEPETSAAFFGAEYLFDKTRKPFRIPVWTGDRILVEVRNDGDRPMMLVTAFIGLDGTISKARVKKMKAKKTKKTRTKTGAKRATTKRTKKAKKP